MQRLEVSCALRHIYTSLGAKGLKERWPSLSLGCVQLSELLTGQLINYAHETYTELF